MKFILICSDNFVVRRTVSDLFPNKQDFKLIMSKVTKALPFDRYDVVMLDCDSASLEFIESIINEYPDIHKKIILMVSSVTYEDVEQMKRLNVTQIIKKPFNIKTLAEKISKVIHQ